MSDETKVIRGLESSIISSTSNINKIILIKKFLKDSNETSDVKISAIHSLRRVFVHFVTSGEIVHEAQSKQGLPDSEYRSWLTKQFVATYEIMASILKGDDDSMDAVIIRTLLELTKLAGTAMSRDFDSCTVEDNFCLYTFQLLLSSLIFSARETDVDSLLLLRNEVFSHHDCTFYALFAMRGILKELKEDPSSTASSISVKNAVDLMRILSLPQSEEDDAGPIEPNEATFLIQSIEEESSNPKKRKLLNREVEVDSASDSEGSEDEEIKKPAGRKKAKKVDLARRAVTTTGGKGKASTLLPLSKQLRRLPCYRRLFSKCWQLLLALPMNLSLHKVVLKHLPNHVMDNLTRPILLADYLSVCYSSGCSNDPCSKGSKGIAVLALESLFSLILRHNLDYPLFFQSLYRLCTVEVFSAKCRHTFFVLLSKALQSTNLTAHMVAAFVKRLAELSLHVSSCSSRYCIAQITCLLRKHPQCAPLIHRISGSKCLHQQVELGLGCDDDHELAELTGALDSSSLWELLLAERHFLSEVAELATALRDPRSTDNGRAGFHTKVEEHMEVKYSEVLQNQLAQLKAKKSKAALAHRHPETLLPEGSVARRCFG